MLKIIVPGDEIYDEKTEEFGTVGDVTIEMEHSLVSLSKWESIFEKPFLSSEEKTVEEIFEYIKCMSLEAEISPEVFSKLTKGNIEQINDYINAKMTATWFRDLPGAKRNRETITSELIYFWMIQFNIPFECENWHLNRLFTLIRVCNEKTQKPKPMSRADAIAQQKALNAQRRAQLNSTG
jgi:hypothetical protein